MRATLAACAVVVLAACGASESALPTATGESRSAVAGAALDGQFVSLDQFRGRPVFVNVWSSW